MDIFTYNLEENLSQVHHDLVTGTYKHGLYRTFQVTDKKKRTISVAPILDRIVHRLVNEYLTALFDKSFIYDVWSCRKGKGLLRAIERTQYLLGKYRYGYVWRSDITKFFDTVDHKILKNTVRRKVFDRGALKIIDRIVDSYYVKEKGTGMPIGNLTSQIFANIYLNELDRFVEHTVKPLGYLRYGDDFLVVAENSQIAKEYEILITFFINNILKLTINNKNSLIIPVASGLHFLGCDIYPNMRRLQKRLRKRILTYLNLENSGSYRGLVTKHNDTSMKNLIDWMLVEKVGY